MSQTNHFQTSLIPPHPHSVIPCLIASAHAALNPWTVLPWLISTISMGIMLPPYSGAALLAAGCARLSMILSTGNRGRSRSRSRPEVKPVVEADTEAVVAGVGEGVGGSEGGGGRRATSERDWRS